MEKTNFNNSSIIKTNETYAEINDALEKAAFSLAISLKDPEMRKKIKSEVGKKFDGDFDVLYKDIKTIKISDELSFKNKLSIGFVGYKKSKGEIIDSKTAEAEMETLTAKIPKFQIAIPVHYNRWNEENTVPLVTYRPVGIKDKNLDKVIAFDSDGKRYELNAKKEPDFPVIVLGVNERTELDGSLRKDMFLNGGNSFGGTYKNVPIKKSSISGKNGNNINASGDALGLYITIFEQYWNSEIWDSWLEGDPEFYIDSYCGQANNQTYRGRVYFDAPQPERYYPNSLLFCKNAPFMPGNVVHLHVAEEDGGTLGGDDDCEDFYIYNYPYGLLWMMGGNNCVNIEAEWREI